MQDRKYHKIRLSEARKDYIKLLKDHLPMEILSIGIPTIPNIILGKIYYTITNALLYEIGFLVIVFGVLFLWKSLRVVPERIYNKQQDIIKSKQKTINLLEEQQKPKLEIRFDENNPRYANDTCKWSKNEQTGEIICIEASHTYRISIYNSSKTTIEDVEAKLDKINSVVHPSGHKIPMYESIMPVHFKFTNDKKPYKTSCEIHPDDDKTVDIIACFMISVQVKNDHFVFQYIEDVYPYLQFDIDKDDFEITIKVTGRNVTCEPRSFMIGLREGKLLMWQINQDAINS